MASLHTRATARRNTWPRCEPMARRRCTGSRSLPCGVLPRRKYSSSTKVFPKWHPQPIEVYPYTPRHIRINDLARKCDLIDWYQSLTGKILRFKDLGADFRLTHPSPPLILPHESNTQGGSLGRILVRSGSSQLRCDASLASHGEIDSHRFHSRVVGLWIARLDVTIRDAAWRSGGL